MRRLLVCLALALFAAPAAACINDGELPGHEREFRSQYRDSPLAMLSEASPTRWIPFRYQAMIGSGMLLATGATMVVLHRRGK